MPLHCFLVLLIVTYSILFSYFNKIFYLELILTIFNPH